MASFAVKAEPAGTKERIVEVASRLFGEQSFEVPIRDIAAAAGVNIGAVNYHFGSKLELIRHVMKALTEPVTEQRLLLLERYERDCDGRYEVEPIVTIFVRPFVMFSKAQEAAGICFPRIMAMSRVLPGEFLHQFIVEQHTLEAQRFTRALEQALPGIDPAAVFWHYDFMIGMMLNVLGDAYRGHRLKEVSGGRCDTDDPEAIIAQLVAFIVRGMPASPAGSTAAA